MIKRMAPSLLKAALQRQTRTAAARLAKSMPKHATAKPTLRMTTRLTRDVFEQLPNGRSGLGNSLGVARDTDISLVRQTGQPRPNVTPGRAVTVSAEDLNLAAIPKDVLENLIERAREATGNGGPIAKGQDKEWGEDTQVHRPDGTEIG